MNLKTLIAAAAIVMAPITASAMTINFGQLDITGFAETRDLTDAVAGDVIAGGQAADQAGIDVDFLNDDKGVVVNATGIFALEGIMLNDIADMTDIDFSAAPSTIYTVGIFTFTGQEYIAFSQVEATIDTAGSKSFTVAGVLTGGDYDPTDAYMSFTTQNSEVSVSFSTTTTVPLPAGVLLMGTALAGFGVMRRRKQRA